MNLNDILKNTAVVKAEEVMMSTIVTLFQERPAYEKAQLAGSMGAKLLISPEFKGRLPLGTDIDFVFDGIPSNLKKDLAVRKLIDFAERRYCKQGVVETVAYSKHEVYDLPEKKFDLVDTFIGSMGSLRLPDLTPVSFNYDPETRTHELRVAHPGFLAACCLYAGGLKRLNRLRFILETSMKDNHFRIDYYNIAEACRHTLDISNVGEKDIEETLRHARHRYGHDKLYMDFIGKAVQTKS